MKSANPLLGKVLHKYLSSRHCERSGAIQGLWIATPSVPLEPMGLTRMANDRHRGQSGLGQPPHGERRLAMTNLLALWTDW
ncbi:MAG: hypothetical protein HY579_11380 [Nitrospinae bacterium]|nr:hypothetical protein [Nitrospinota bacterium]